MEWGLLDRQEDRDYQYFDGVQICVCAIICKTKEICKSEFVERFPELSLFYGLSSPLDSEMICIFPYFCPYAESAREIREVFI